MERKFGKDIVMLKKDRTAVIFTANTPHLAQADLMLTSLRDETRGNFQGDIWVISTDLSVRARNYLDSIGVHFLINPIRYVWEWKYWKQIAKNQPDYAGLCDEFGQESALERAFEQYRNKRMSKLILLDWIEKFGAEYDFIVLCDNDLYFQRDIHELFKDYYEKGANKVYYWQEENEISSNSLLWWKDYRYSECHDATNLEFGNHEINIGFIMGSPKKVGEVFQNVKRGFFSLDIKLFSDYSWHDQDLVRLDRANRPDAYELFVEGKVLHLCNGGTQVVEERYPGEFYHTKTGEKPYVIHFAGGQWKKYGSIKASFTINPDIYYFNQEMKKEYDIIRKGASQNIFDDVSGFYTEQNKESRKSYRENWLQLRGNRKKKLLFVGWMEVPTHKSTMKAIPEFFHSELYDIAILNGNVTGKKSDFSCEEFPELIAKFTQISKNPYLIRTFGIKMDGIPKELYDECVKASMLEYNCTERTAIAIATITYMYFSEAIDFYRPELLCLWGCFSPWGRMISDICRWKKIPVCFMEWGVLPGTVSFDFSGSMAESWVAKESGFFNKLPISDGDIEIGRRYLEIANSPELSRNVPQELRDSDVEQIRNYRKRGKKIILYMGCNEAHSGISLTDESRARIHSPFYRNDSEAYQDLVRVCRQHKDWHIVYKPHPIEITRGMKVDIDASCTTVIYEGGLSEALKLADVSMTILSQSAYVSLVNHVPVVLLGRLQLNDSGAAYVLDSREHLEDIIAEGLEHGITPVMQESLLFHVSRLLKYYTYRADSRVGAMEPGQIGDNLVKIMESCPTEQYKFEWECYQKQRPSHNASVYEAPLVSIIMPVYNAEEYLAESINSICRQTLENIELICVNNGSTDRSQEILEYFAALDERIRIHQIDQANQRIARNWGYDHARGKYVYLMDSDDYLDFDALKKLTDISEEKNADVLYFFFREVRTDSKPSRPRPRFYTYRKFFPKDKVFKLSKELYKFFIQYPFPWAKLIRREVVLEKKLYFDVECINFDDNPHNLRVLLASENVYVYNEQLYNFRIHNKSMTQSKNPRVLGMIDAVRCMNKIYEEFGCYDEYAKWYVPYKVHLIGWAWENVPDELKLEYYGNAKQLFLPGDEAYFHDDSIWSFFEMPSRKVLTRVRRILQGNFFEFIQSENVVVSKENFHHGSRDIRSILEPPDFIRNCINDPMKITTQLSAKDETWEKIIKKIYQDDIQKVYIWGAGAAYKSLYPLHKEILENVIHIAGIVDSNTEIIGKIESVVGKYVIQSPETLKKYNPKEVAVIISTKDYADEIIESLKKMGITNYHSWCLIEWNSERAKRYRAKLL